MASGVAITNATAEETRVPNKAGAAPNEPPATSQLLDVTMDNPSLANAGQAAAKIATAIDITSAGTTSAHATVMSS